MAWNALPDDLRDPSLSADNFRKTLKTHMFRNALGHLTHQRRCVMRYINLRLTYLLTYLLRTERHSAPMSKIKSNGLNQSGTQCQCARTDALARCYSVIVLLIAELHSLFTNLLYQFNGWDLKMQLFKYSASRHQQDRGILLETDARAMKIVPRGCLEVRQCLEEPNH